MARLLCSILPIWMLPVKENTGLGFSSEITMEDMNEAPGRLCTPAARHAYDAVAGDTHHTDQAQRLLAWEP
ncbi:MAG: hypothetical protein R2744_12745 [Bacteroidales bacterium]